MTHDAPHRFPPQGHARLVPGSAGSLPARPALASVARSWFPARPAAPDRAVTLIELIAAVSLLAVIAVAAVGWLRIAGRSARSVGEEARRWAQETAAVRLLRDDLRLGTPPTLAEDGTQLRLVTLHAVGAAGRRTVTWRIADDALLRATGPDNARRVVVGLPPQRWHRDEDGALWWLLDIAEGADPTAADRRYRIWSAAW